MVEIGAAVQILREQLAAFRERHHIRVQRIELRRRHRLVVVPPDGVLGTGIADHKLVIGRTAGMNAGEHDQRPVLRHVAFAAPHRFFVKRRSREVPVHGLQVPKALLLQPKGGFL
jgi:hypothetical protein